MLALGAVLAGVARGPGLMRGLRAALPVSAGLAGLALGQVEASALWLLPAQLLQPLKDARCSAHAVSAKRRRAGRNARRAPN